MNARTLVRRPLIELAKPLLSISSVAAPILSAYYRKNDVTAVRRAACRWLSSAMFEVYFDERTSTAERERLKAMCMTATGGVAWARHYAAQPFPDEEAVAAPIWNWISDVLASGEIGSVHQVAASSGREVAYFARQFPSVTFVGSDIDLAIAEEAARIWGNVPNLRFAALNLVNLHDGDERIAADLVFTSGGLQYLDAASLSQFLGIVANTAKWIAISEPVSKLFAGGRAARKGAFSWNHDYAGQLHAAGFVVEKFEALTSAETPWARKEIFLARAHSR